MTSERGELTETSPMNGLRKESELENGGSTATDLLGGVEKEVEKESQTSGVQPKKSRADFLFLAELGEGSFSTVYLATERSTSREFAVKVCDKKQIIRERKVQQIYREKEAMARLSQKENHNPFIVRIYCTFQDSDSLYIVMTIAKGGELLQKLKKYKVFSLDVTKFYASEILSALSHMHKLLIVHRDLKPENILLAASGHILISDFGSSKILDSEPGKVGPNENAERRRRCSFVGTAQYVSPEVLNGTPVQQACDYWAFGVIIYQFLSGHRAFNEASEYLMYKKILKADYKFPEDFPSVARSLVEKLIVVNAEERLGSVESGGAEAVMKHPFFDAVDWSNLENANPPLLD